MHESGRPETCMVGGSLRPSMTSAPAGTNRRGSLFSAARHSRCLRAAIETAFIKGDDSNGGFARVQKFFAFGAIYVGR